MSQSRRWATHFFVWFQVFVFHPSFAAEKSFVHVNGPISDWQDIRLIEDLNDHFSAAQAWEQSQSTQALLLSQPDQSVPAMGAKTFWAAWRLPASVVQDLPFWLSVYVPACVDTELWVRWNNGE